MIWNDELAADRYYLGVEDHEALARRVGNFVANGDDNLAPSLIDAILQMKFIPGGRILRNAARPKGGLINCYGFSIPDNIEGIAQTVANCMILNAEGGGVGLNGSEVRPEGDPIKGKGGNASGPISWAKIINTSSGVIETGGQRRAAMLFMLRIDHPDILKFIDAKVRHDALSNFNISVGITNDFIKAVQEDEDWILQFRGREYKTIKAKKLWDQIIENMLKHAEPGILNLSNLYKNNSWTVGYPITITNPSMRKGTRVLTNLGIVPIEYLEDRDFSIIGLDGNKSKARCFLSGRNKKLYKVNITGGHSYYATAEHTWPVVRKDKWNYTPDDMSKKKTVELTPGDHLPLPSLKSTLGYGYKGTYEDGFVIGWNLGDGWITYLKEEDRTQIGFIVSNEDKKYNIHRKISMWLEKLGWTGSFEDKNEINVRRRNVESTFEEFRAIHKSNGIPESIWTVASEEFRKGFIDGLFSSDGCFSGKITLVTSHKKVAEDVADLLGFYGISAHICHTIHRGGNFPSGLSKKNYQRYTISISRYSSILHFVDIFSLSHKRKQQQLESLVSTKLVRPSRTAEIISIELTDIHEDVWDITVFDDAHCFELAHSIAGNCGELPVEHGGACCLGSMVLPAFVDDGIFDWKDFDNTVEIAVRALDNILDVNNWALQLNRDQAYDLRRIGLGTMGLADCLFGMGVRYGSKECIDFLDDLYRRFRNVAYRTSIAIANEKGSFPKFTGRYCKAKFIKNLPRGIQRDIKENGIRNVTILTSPPNGTTALLIGTNSGIEPLFAKAYERNDRHNKKTIITHPLAEAGCKEDWFVDAQDITPFEHLEVQATIQKYLDGAVAKTINVPADYTGEDLDNLLLSYMEEVKGVTVYREGSREGQVLTPVDCVGGTCDV